MELKKIFKSGQKFWLVFAACFVVSQAINLWAVFPGYTNWHIFGFPLIYINYQYGTEYVYFNIIFFAIDLLVWYLVAKAIVYGQGQMSKFRILK